MESISVFELIKVGIGPSSSHTMGPWRAGQSFITWLKDNGTFNSVKQIQVHLYGSLAKTGKGHGSDIAVTLALSGEIYTKINTDLISDKIEKIKKEGALIFNNERKLRFDFTKDIIFHYDQTLELHPNGMKFSATLSDASVIEKIYFSIGGGFIINEEKGCTVKEKREARKIKTVYPCHDAKTILKRTSELELSFSKLILLNEQAWNTPEQVHEKCLELWKEMKKCIYRGISKDGELPGGLRVVRRAKSINDNLLEQQKYQNTNE